MKPLLENPDPKAVDLDRLGKLFPERKGASARPAMSTGPPCDHGNDEFAFWRFKDLVERRIVTDRTDLHRKQQRGFPRAVKFSKSQGAVALFAVAAVKLWVRENLGAVDPADCLCDRPRGQTARNIEHSAAE